MECQMLVVFAGGTCGDIVCELIDKGTMPIFEDKYRSKLKHLDQFKDDAEKLKFMKEAENKFKSIPSHDLDFHIEHQHNFIGITATDSQDRLWASERFKRKNQPESWQVMTAISGADSIESYAEVIDQMTQRIQITKQPTIDLKDIRKGQLIERLNALNIQLISGAKDHYQQWLGRH